MKDFTLYGTLVVVDDNVHAASEGVVMHVSNKVTWEMTSFATSCWYKLQKGFNIWSIKQKSILGKQNLNHNPSLKVLRKKSTSRPNLLRQTIGSVIKSGVGASWVRRRRHTTLCTVFIIQCLISIVSYRINNPIFSEATFVAKVTSKIHSIRTWWKLWKWKRQISVKNTLWQFVCLTALCLGIVLQIVALTICFLSMRNPESWIQVECTLSDSLVSVQSPLSSTFRRFRLISVGSSANIAWPEFAWTGSKSPSQNWGFHYLTQP